jgi:carbon-monoxide dehydrogenase large subunit
VRWVADRSEHFLGDAHGRDNLSHAEMALDASGKFLALRVDIRANLGAYLSQFGPYIPWLAVSMASGPYDIGAVHARVRAIYTHTIPVDAYRGAGRPEAAYLLERLVDQCAYALNMPRDEIRARNFVKPDEMPYKTHTERTYDVGEFEAVMRRALQSAGYRDFAGREAMSRASGKIRGLGFASYIECTAWGEGHRLRTDRRAASRRRAGARENRAGRHGGIADRRRHRWLALDSGRRGDGVARLRKAGRAIERAREREAGDRRGRSRDRRWLDSRYRHRSRDCI